MTDNMPNFMELVQKTLNQIKHGRVLGYYFKVIVFQSLINIAVILPAFIVIFVILLVMGVRVPETDLSSGVLPFFSDNSSAMVFLILLALVVPLALYMSGFNYATNTKMALNIANDALEDAKATIRFGFSKAIKMAFIGLLMSIIIVFGLILLILPGIIFAVLLQYSGWVAIDQNTSVGASLKHSWNMVKTNFWTIVLYGIGVFCLIVVVQILISVIGSYLGSETLASIIGMLVSFLTNYFSLVFFTNLYFAVKGTDQTGGLSGGNGAEGSGGGGMSIPMNASGRSTLLASQAIDTTVAETTNMSETLPPNNLNTIPE